jgi:hypothetical protein
LYNFVYFNEYIPNCLTGDDSSSAAAMGDDDHEDMMEEKKKDRPTNTIGVRPEPGHLFLIIIDIFLY